MSCTEVKTNAEIREVDPTPDGWRRYECTGIRSFACSCGTRARGRADEIDALAGPHVQRCLRVTQTGEA